MLFPLFHYNISLLITSTCEKNALYVWSNLVLLGKYDAPSRARMAQKDI